MTRDLPENRMTLTPEDEALFAFDEANNAEPYRTIAKRIAQTHGFHEHHPLVDEISHALEDAHDLGGKRAPFLSAALRAPIKAPSERDVARAICKSRTCEGVNCCQWPSQAGRRHDCPVERGNYDEAARAVLALIPAQARSEEDIARAMYDAGLYGDDEDDALSWDDLQFRIRNADGELHRELVAVTNWYRKIARAVLALLPAQTGEGWQHRAAEAISRHMNVWVTWPENERVEALTGALSEFAGEGPAQSTPAASAGTSPSASPRGGPAPAVQAGEAWQPIARELWQVIDDAHDMMAEGHPYGHIVAKLVGTIQKYRALCAPPQGGTR